MEPAIPAQQQKQDTKSSPDLSEFTSQLQDLSSKLKSLESGQKNLDSKFTLKLKEIDLNMKKQIEDGEGRDGLILQQNQDISSLFENERSINAQIEEANQKISQLEESLSQFATTEMVNDQLQQALEQLETQIREVTQQEVKQSLEESLPQIDAHAKGLVESLRKNQEGRMQLSIDGLKQVFQESLGELSGQVEMLESQNEVVEQLQNQIEGILAKVQKLDNDFKNIGNS